MDNWYYLMNGDEIVMLLRQVQDLDEMSYVEAERRSSYVPYGFTTPDAWIESRQIAKHRKQIYAMMQDWGLHRREGFIAFTHCASLTDSFWIKAADSDLTWKDVNLFERKNLYATSPEFATSGSYEKCWRRTEQGIFLYKRGSSGAVNAGMEPFSEKLTSDLLDAAGFAHVPYTLEKYHQKLASVCPLFTSEQSGFVSFAAFSQKDVVNPREIMETIGRVADEDRFREMVIADAISLNVDRHQGNYGFLINNRTGAVEGFAPLFDHNLAQLPFLMQTDDVHEYLKGQGPRIGAEFVSIARAVLTPKYRSLLINLKETGSKMSRSTRSWVNKETGKRVFPEKKIQKPPSGLSDSRLPGRGFFFSFLFQVFIPAFEIRSFSAFTKVLFNSVPF